MAKLPITALIVTKNEATQIAGCVQNLIPHFAQVLVVDSHSEDGSADLARHAGAQVRHFEWNGGYPKKRQWCLNNFKDDIAHHWVFFIDADERVTREFINEIAQTSWAQTLQAGYWVTADYVLQGRRLKHGLKNKKLCLLHKDRMVFPVIDDLDVDGMGEVEGHYHPVVRPEYIGSPVGHISAPILHDAMQGMDRWKARHIRYAQWQDAMDARKAWPDQGRGLRAIAKRIFRHLPKPARAAIAFAFSYIILQGFRDGSAGLSYATLRAWGYGL